MAEEQSRRAQAGGDQFLQADRGRRVAAGKFGHEGDARLFDPLFDLLGFLEFQIEPRRAIDGLAGIAGGQDRQRAVPLRRENENGVDILPRGERAVAVHGIGVEFGGGLFGAMRDLIAHRTDLEAIGHRSQRRGMPRLPDVAQSDEADAEFHEICFCVKCVKEILLADATSDYIVHPR